MTGTQSTAARRRSRYSFAWVFLLVLAFIPLLALTPSAWALSAGIKADSRVVKHDGGTMVRWWSKGAKGCWSRGKWGADRRRWGKHWTGRLRQKTWFGIACTDGNRVVYDGVTVEVRDPRVSVDLWASARTVRPGGKVKLSWSSRNANSCTAGGNWSGGRASRGSMTTWPLHASKYFKLTCVNGRQTAVSSVSVQVGEVPVVRWRAPKRNEDGTWLNDLAGYYFYWGTRSGRYPNKRRIWNAGMTEYRPKHLSRGSYYVVVTAVNGKGEESGYSNEIRLEVP